MRGTHAVIAEILVSNKCAIKKHAVDSVDVEYLMEFEDFTEYFVENAVRLYSLKKNRLRR